MSTIDRITVLTPREVPLGGPRAMPVWRTLPARETSLVGAWCFADHFGPDDVAETGGMAVARHPHTGLATVSWLFEGAITHRDSLGSHALVNPGDVDLMVAGRGITHSEFSTNDTTVLHGLQLWYALPDRTRFRDREFLVHTAAVHRTERMEVRVGLGSARVSDDAGGRVEDDGPVETDLPLHLVQVELDAGAAATLDLVTTHEYALIVDRGRARLEVAGGTAEIAERDNAVLPDGAEQVRVEALGEEPLRVVLIGGEPLGEDIVMWWNFIGRDHDEIARFRDAYQAAIGDPEAETPWAEGDTQFGPWPKHTPAALPAPRMPGLRLKPRGRAGRRA
ncbi:pirin family protein [Brachybacterium sp. EF45031]|uniref:pirin family protein n=1 Tax=Brachybacterium sillae TaxID=2810536 RepID=UPI00217EF4D4|nr:pirin family protein [Brachybacterium sillae]MCS6711205.1 pirin family protein [Brachybacterium sillae]